MYMNIKDNYEQIAAMPETVKIRMRDYYPNYTGEQEYCEITWDIYEEFYMGLEKKKNRERRMDWLHISKYPFDEILMGEMDGIFEQSAEDLMITKLKYKALYDAMKKLNPVLRRRVFYCYFQEMSNKEIAELEGVTPSAVNQSLNTAVEKLSEIIKVRDVM